MIMSVDCWLCDVRVWSCGVLIMCSMLRGLIAPLG
jgi:hypothetical protein